jgi:c-di-GMP-binding flagellar brake protein YcgR
MKEQKIKPHYGIVNFERRKHPRFNIDLPIEYHLVDSSVGQLGRAMNVSEGGLLVYLPDQLEIGQYLQLKLFFPSGSQLTVIEMLTEVVWGDIPLGKDGGDYRSGLRFIEISSEDLQKLKTFLRSFSD